MIEFVQILECCIERTDSRAHDRMDAVRSEKRGLLGIDRGGKIWVYDYAQLGWLPFHTGSLG